MTAASRLRRAHAVLAVLSLATALGWGLAVGVGLVAGAAAFDAWMGLPLVLRELVPEAASVAAGVTAALVAWRLRRVTSARAVSLWMEERHPELGFALVTALEPGTVSAPPVPPIAFAWTAFSRGMNALWKPALALAASVLLLAALPPGVVRRVTAPQPGDALERVTGPVENPLAVVVVRVEPPAYTRLAAGVTENPTTVTALVGSHVTASGALGPVPVSAKVGTTGARVTSDSQRWTATFAMPDSAVTLELRAGERSELIAFDPIQDSVPVVRFTHPARDTVMRVAEGATELHAEARDDFGIESLWFELIVSSGQGESFTFRSAVLGRVAVTGGRSAATSAALALDSLRLAAGDVVHLRAVARDMNAVTGPGVGVSETRSIRIARPGEYDTAATVVLPPIEPDTSVLSQRMLIMLAEALVERRGDLARPAFVRESQAIGRDQERLRRRVAEVVFMRLGGEEGEHAHGEPEPARAGLTPAELLAAAEDAVQGAIGEVLDFHGDETPVVAVSRPLLEAYNAMWDAARELNVGEPDRALPHMYAALNAIQRARAAERIYLRGRPAAVVVDLARVRLTGNRRTADPGAASGLETPRVTTGERASRVIALALAGNPAARDSALIVRTAVLGSDPPLAAALAELAAAIGAGREATDALLLLRRALADPPRVQGRLAPWGGGW